MSSEVNLDSAERDLPVFGDTPNVKSSIWNGRVVSPGCQRFLNCISWLSKPFETIGRGLFEESDVDVSTAPALSMHFETDGHENPSFRIEGINGVSTLPYEAFSHAEYLKGFSPDNRVGWVYNRTHSLVTDVSEVFFMNFFGYSPNTANLLLNNWKTFHRENAGKPQAKLLQFCHSQGALHVRNALIQASLEIRQRVIVVAIAPAVIVPKSICHNSYNYGSRQDFIPYVELSFLGAFDTNEFRMAKPLQMALEHREELILLDSDIPFDHDFQSPTFKEVIGDHIQEYLAVAN